MNDLLLSAKGLHKTYVLGQRSLQVLRGVDIEMRRGDFLALRGASGAGKSTLLHLLGGLDSPNEGEIWLAGRNLATLSRSDLARLRNREIGFIFQAYYLLPELDALENVCHLRDLELQGYRPRISCLLDETDPALADFDGARVAAESNYNSQQPDVALQTFEMARRENVQRLRGLTEEQLGREGILEGVGRITLRRLAEMMREHDEGHIEDVRVLRQRLERQHAHQNRER